MNSLIVTVIFMSLFEKCDSAHFLGGIITFRPTGNGNQVNGYIRTGWNSNNKHCDASSINSKTSSSLDSASCLSCSTTGDSSISLSGLCTGFSTPTKWTSFRSTFTVTPQNNEFSLSLSGGDWVQFSSWLIVTEANITPRQDTGKINTSPTVETLPIIYLQYGCYNKITFPVWDEDGDTVRCRFAKIQNAKGHDECGSLCSNYPDAVFEKEGCTLTFVSNGTIGYRGVAIQVEDFSKSDTTKPLSSVGAQFLMYIYDTSTACSSAPRFVTPTPANGLCFINGKGIFFFFLIKAFSTSSQNMSINTVSPLGAPRGQEVHVRNLTGSYTSLTVTWLPTDADLNQAHHVCFEAVDSNGLHSEQRCVIILVKEKCQPPPSVRFGLVTVNDYCPSQSASYTCYEGFALIGDSVLHCRRNRSWSGIAPTCKIVEKVLGESCVNPNKTGLKPEEHCSTSNAVCTQTNTTHYTCRCKPTHYDSDGESTMGGTCELKQILGGSCVNPSKTGLKPEEHCSTSNAVCTQVENTTNFTCRCKPTHYDSDGENTTGGTCELKQILGGNCVNPNKTGLKPEEHCSTLNAVCTQAENATHYTCLCKPNYYDDNSDSNVGGKCEPEQILGESCVNPIFTGLNPEQHCSDPNALCTSAESSSSYICRCKQTYYDDNGGKSGGTCKQKSALGDSCERLSEEINDVTFTCLDVNSDCVSDDNEQDNICRCNPDYFDDNDNHVPGGSCKPKVPLGAVCPEILSKTDTCLDPNGVCSLEKETNQHKCACNPGFYQSDGTVGEITCRIKHDFGARCKESFQCSTWSAVCKGDEDDISRCMCQDGFTFEESSNVCKGQSMYRCLYRYHSAPSAVDWNPSIWL